MVAALVVSAVASVAAAAESAHMASKQASAAASAADYNAKLDIVKAQQLTMDANANISKQREQDATYMSSQRAALAAAGVLENTGSPLSLEATTAGRMEQNIQQYWTTVERRETALYESAQEGVEAGAEEASIYHLEGAADIFKGIGGVASTAASPQAARAFGYG